MKELYTHKVMTSFCMWFDHTLTNMAQAYTNYSGQLYYMSDDRMDGIATTFSSPFKQWIADSSVNGAIVPTGVTVDGVPVARGTSGCMIDFDNGRVLLDPAISEDASVYAQYSMKSMNLYMAEDSEEELLFAKKFNLNSRYGDITPSGIPPYDFVLPAAFVMQNFSNNEPFALGGEQDSKSKVRVIIMTDQGHDLDGTISLFRDLRDSNIAFFSGQQYPFNEYGDLKNGSYNYLDLVNQNQDERMLFLEKVTTSKIVNVSERRNFPNIKFGIIDFYLSEPRFPKQDL